MTQEVQPTTAGARAEHQQLVEEIEDARWRYFVLDDPTLSDIGRKFIDSIPEGMTVEVRAGGQG